MLGLTMGEHCLPTQRTDGKDGGKGDLDAQDRSNPLCRQVIEAMRTGQPLPDGFKEIEIKDPEGEPFPNIVKNQADSLAQKFGAEDRKSAVTMPVFCTFIPGGMGTNEVRELRSLENDKHVGPLITICSGTRLMSPKEYVAELRRINQVDEDVATIRVDGGPEEGDALLDSQL